MAVNLAVFFSDSAAVARLKDIHTAGYAQRGAEFRVASKKRHAIPEIAGIPRFKPETAPAFRRSIAIMRNIGGEQRFPLPERPGADVVRLPCRPGITGDLSQIGRASCRERV